MRDEVPVIQPLTGMAVLDSLQNLKAVWQRLVLVTSKSSQETAAVSHHDFMINGNRSLWSSFMTDVLLAVLVTTIILAALLSTSRDYAMAFDEGFTVNRERVLARWFSAVVNPPAGFTRSDVFSREAMERFWPFSRKEPDGHPPVYALIGLAGWWVAHAWVAPLTSYRIGPMALTAVTVGILYLFLARRHGRLTGLTAAVLLVFLPRTFSHAHYAHYDMPVTCLWLLTQVAFLKSLRSPRWIVAFGLLLGLAAGTKFTGWFAVAPPLAWAILYEWMPRAYHSVARLTIGGPSRVIHQDPQVAWTATRIVALGTVIAAITLYAVQPPWWSDPVWGVERFLTSNLSRDKSIPVPSLYLGKVYPFSLPWHNTLVLTAVTTPVLVLALGLVGIGSALARFRSNPEGLLWVLSWGVLMVVRALPNAPGHDVERLILPGLASLSILAGLGTGVLAQQFARWKMSLIAPALSAMAIGECALGIAQTYPYNLSYYNLAIGGPAGAERLGFEPTYYWETLGPEFFTWLRQLTVREPVELHFPFGLLNIILLREWGVFPKNVKVVLLDPASHPYYVLQRNPGTFSPYDWWLERHGHPVFAINRQGVDLLRVYGFDELAHACQVTEGQPGVQDTALRPDQGFP